jgi:hypothetical protein
METLCITCTAHLVPIEDLPNNYKPKIVSFIWPRLRNYVFHVELFEKITVTEQNSDGSGFCFGSHWRKNHKTEYSNRSLGQESKPIFTEYGTGMLTPGPWPSVKSNLGKGEDSFQASMQCTMAFAFRNLKIRKRCGHCPRFELQASYTPITSSWGGGRILRTA